jgi:putative hydrolase of the HAD superfamily
MIRQGPNFLVDKDGNKESTRASSGASRRAGPAFKNVATFKNVESWIFDLDNTLYPHHLNLWQQVDVRIRDYIVDFLKVTHEEAFRLQKDYYRRYGTTLRGLMEEHGLEPDQFLEIVHQIDHSAPPLPRCPAANSFLPTEPAATPMR